MPKHPYNLTGLLYCLVIYDMLLYECILHQVVSYQSIKEVVNSTHKSKCNQFNKMETA